MEIKWNKPNGQTKLEVSGQQQLANEVNDKHGNRTEPRKNIYKINTEYEVMAYFSNWSLS